MAPTFLRNEGQRAAVAAMRGLHVDQSHRRIALSAKSPVNSRVALGKNEGKPAAFRVALDDRP